MRTFTASGANGFTFVEIDSDSMPVGYMTVHITVPPGAPALLAVVFDPITGALPRVGGAQIFLTGPDGTIYNAAANSATMFAAVTGAGPAAFCLAQPVAGQWSLTCQCAANVSYRAMACVPATANAVTSALQALTHFHGQPVGVSAPQYQLELFRWTYLGLAALTTAMSATSGLVINLAGLIANVLGANAAQVRQILAAPGTVPNAGIALIMAQALGFATTNTTQQIIVNGDASQALTGWTILASGGNGWGTQSGYADRIQYASNFTVSNGWCKASQLIDLVAGCGISPAYLDRSPPISVRDWIMAAYPAGATPSQYYLTVELRDAASNPLKRFQTGVLSIPDMRWLPVACVFSNYGPGVRFVHVEHGGLDAAVYAPANGLKITGADVSVVLGLPTNPPRELVVNGSALAGMNGWTTGAGEWNVETGPAVACPGSPGTTSFSAGQTPATKSQLIDLLASGFTPEFLDTSPVVEASDWICAEPNCTCTFAFTVELRDAQQNVLMRYATGAITVPPSPGGVTTFAQFAQTLSECPPGLRYIYFEDSASSGVAAMTAKLTGASVRFLTPVLPPHQTREHPMPADVPADMPADALATAPTPVQNTNVSPYYWICQLAIAYNDPNHSNYVCSGWLIPQPMQNTFFVVSAAHCIRGRDLGWPSQIGVSPARNDTTRPYTTAMVPRGRMQLPIEWLVNNQAQPTLGALYDYAGLYVVGTHDWRTDGFALTVETDAQLANQAATITGYPAAEPYTPGRMYTESLTVSPWNATQVTVPTDLTGGSSGCPVYVGGANAISIQSYGTKWGLTSNGTTRINQAVKDCITKWTQPLTPATRVTKLQMVIRTGTDWGAGTDDDITCTIDGHLYDLESLWFGGAGLVRSRNEPGDFDGYDLTPQLNAIYPQGITVGELTTKSYTITRVIPILMYHSLANGDWQVESVAVWVNDQLLCATNFFQWINYNPLGSGLGAITGQFKLF